MPDSIPYDEWFHKDYKNPYETSHRKELSWALVTSSVTMPVRIPPI